MGAAQVASTGVLLSQGIGNSSSPEWSRAFRQVGLHWFRHSPHWATPRVEESGQVFSTLCTVLCTVRTLGNHVLLHACVWDDLFLNSVIILSALKVESRVRSFPQSCDEWWYFPARFRFKGPSMQFRWIVLILTLLTSGMLFKNQVICASISCYAEGNFPGLFLHVHIGLNTALRPKLRYGKHSTLF